MPTLCRSPIPFNSYDVTENTTSMYLETEFAGSNWSGNAGVRVVRTKTTARYAAVGAGIAVDPDHRRLHANLERAIRHLAVPDDQRRLHAGAAVGEPQLLAGAAAAATARRGRPKPCHARISISWRRTPPTMPRTATPSLFYTGTVGLRPIKATQADLSLEWYYARHSALTAAVFEKRLRDDIYSGTQIGRRSGHAAIRRRTARAPVPGTPFLWTISAPANGAKSVFTGLELTWQHMLDNGFGVHMQYTHTTSKGYDQTGASTGPVNAAPPTTASISLIYDKGPLSADVTWDYTSSYTYACSQCTEIPGWPAIADSFEWMTASVHYKFGKGFEVYVEGKNLTNSIARTYLNGNPLLPWAPGQSVGASASGVGAGYSAYGTTYVLGAAYRM